MPKRNSANAQPVNRASQPLPPGMRVDKWLFCARLTKTRAEAARLVESGAVRVNRVKARKPAAVVCVGDVITLVRHARVRVVRILALPDRRVPARLVPELLEDL